MKMGGRKHEGRDEGRKQKKKERGKQMETARKVRVRQKKR